MGLSGARSEYGCGSECRRGWEDLDVEAAAVMAPALTDGGPQQPENPLAPLPAGGFLTSEQAAEVCQKREVLAQFVVSASVQPSKIDEQCLSGVSRELIRDVINSKYSSDLDSLSAFASGLDLITRSSRSLVRRVGEEQPTEQARPASSEAKATSTMMSDPSMGDRRPDDEMGFLKSSVEVSATEAEKGAPAEQSTSGCADKPCCPYDGYMGQVEDLLQVFRSLEVAGNAESVAGTGSEVVQGPADGVEMFPIPEGFSSFEKDLLNDVDVDVMSLCNVNVNVNDAEGVERRSEGLKTQQDLVTRKQFESERRCAFLLRRLRKLQAKLLGCHVAEENTGVLELAHRGIKKYLFQELPGGGSKSAASRGFPEVGAGLGSFLQKIEKTCAVRSNTVNRQRGCCRYFGGGSRDNFSNPSTGNAGRHLAFGMPRVKVQRDEVEGAAGPLETQLRVVEASLDSDCTASSSGGESCDEMQTFGNSHQQYLPISKRAGWRYAQDRAGIASRWTWLQAQISDLEYRIRQHNDLQRQIRATKGLVILDNAETVNGYSGVLPGSTGRCNATEGELPASRTRPFVWSIYRKRKLLQIDRLHEVSKRAAKASSVRCNCDSVLPPCALCTGRQDPIQPLEPVEQISVNDRMALVDPGFHPVLSFPDETVHGTHLESIMKSVEWQQKMLRGNLRTTRFKDKESNERRNKKLLEHRAKFSGRLKKSSSAILTARIKRKMLKGKRRRLAHERNIHGLNKKKIAKVPPPDDYDDASVQSGSSKNSSPVPSPLQQVPASTEKLLPKDRSSNVHGRLRQNSYDIDNIVIPYSIAASTRLEKLQYKEILTPKWRVYEENAKTDIKNGIMQKPNQNSDIEDVSDEMVALRHERSEREENKRFMTYVNMPHQTRIRHHRRTDSRADSGANTPDPLSPNASDYGCDVPSPINSPPATPAMMHDLENRTQQMLDTHRPLSFHNAMRRQSISSLRLARDDTTASFTEEDNEVLPYEPRVFPLSEEVYDKMLEAMPDGHWQASSVSLCSREDKGDEECGLDTPESDSTESACCDVEGEDPNDPEWTVADDSEKERIRPTAKR
ncbi:uncharacterized protein LOC105701285 [Orussus abietinus]|uniref:uncharacterized protein LOC105701285 n=1 Tax=Orussus abietinus TaxID=222816 RepID=UPI0006250E22|nr:uncharacterized protein LOC105701285 [Orussus abietinus]XP_012283337.1 uncharacterized protein LOC105701285 [Orussus abietinus]XP_012283338.1 uncharacterized protein LOC105701285 [Orussus abietinus]XP_023289296.1 uncharacterized protein LOC105701285 [Orussus abietinus]